MFEAETPDGSAAHDRVRAQPADADVRSIAVRPVVVPMAAPRPMAGGVLTESPLALIDVRDSEGRIGHSYLRTYDTAALRALVALVEDLAVVVVGHRVAPEALPSRLPQGLRLLGTGGLVGLALAGLDMALWDLVAQAAVMPLGTLLGAAGTSVPAYLTLRAREPEAAAEEAIAAVGRGCDAVKLRLGGRPPDDDARTIAAVRAAVGSSIAILADYNQSLTVDEVLGRAEQLDALGLGWIEEPVAAADLVGSARVAATLATPVQHGENLEGVEGVRQSIALGASDLLMLDVMKVGGVSGWIAAARLAADGGRPVSTHAFPEYSVHLLGASATAHRLEYLDHLAPIRAGELDLRGGRLHAPAQPGVGLHWDEPAIARLTGR